MTAVAHEGNGKNRPLPDPPDHPCIMRDRMNEQEEFASRLLGEIGVLSNRVGREHREVDGRMISATGLYLSIDSINARIGDHGDMSRGIEPNGIYGIILRLSHQVEELNRTMAGDVRPKLDSLVEEEENTQIQSRQALIERTHKSESELERLRRELDVVRAKDEEAAQARVAKALADAQAETARVKALVLKVAGMIALAAASGAGGLEILRRVFPVLFP